MSTATAPPAAPPPVTKEEQPYVDPVATRHIGVKVLAIFAFWVACWLLFAGRDTQSLPAAELTPLHEWLNAVRDWVDANGATSFFFHTVLGGIGAALNSLVGSLQAHLSSPVPGTWLGWAGVLAVFAWVTYALAGVRSMLLVAGTLLALGVLGVWTDGLDTIIVAVVSVVICAVLGIPLGIAMARSRRVSTAVTPVLDVMQTMPSFAYLFPVALVFGIGPSSAVVLTLVYALPPLVRITELGVRSVSADTIEAARSLGVTRSQLLRQVQLPMAKRTIAVGVNQSMMAALSMATIAALVNGPGLGGPVIQALSSQNVGQASIAGLGIVLIAIMLDRTTTAASERAEATSAGWVGGVGYPGLSTQVILERLPRWASETDGRAHTHHLTPAGRRLTLGVLLVPVLVVAYYSTRYLQLATFPDVSGVPVLRELNGPQLAEHINGFTDAVVGALSGATEAVRNALTYALLNPLEGLMATVPWWTMAVVILALAFTLGGWRPAVITVVCEAVIFATGLWHESMRTLTMTLVATLLVMVVAVALGVAMGRSRRADVGIRPVLDGLQTIPAMVYLVPALALFGSSRFTAIIAAVLYAVPISTKLVADGVRGVAAPTVEAARSLGSTSWQMISKVQLPMAREALVLATNQGLLYVLSMVVIGGLVGGGSLGYLIVSGFVQGQLFGKGFAAGIAITAMGIMLDRIARYAAARYGR